MNLDDIPKPQPMPPVKTDKRGAEPGQFGQAPHVPTAKNREMVRSLTAFGNTQEQIATIMQISVDTLDRHYRRELDVGAIEANAQIAQTLYRKALAGCSSSIQYWLSRRAGWTEKTAVDHTSSDGSMTPQKELSYDEFIAELERRGLSADLFDK